MPFLYCQCSRGSINGLGTGADEANKLNRYAPERERGREAEGRIGGRGNGGEGDIKSPPMDSFIRAKPEEGLPGCCLSRQLATVLNIYYLSYYSVWVTSSVHCQPGTDPVVDAVLASNHRLGYFHLRRPSPTFFFSLVWPSIGTITSRKTELQGSHWSYGVDARELASLS